MARPRRDAASTRRRHGLLVPLLVALLAVGCASRGPAPVVDRGSEEPPASGYHVVRRGETLYAIAWRYGYDWRVLARRNGLDPPYTIHPEQRLRVTPRSSPRAAARESRPATPGGSGRPTAGDGGADPVPASSASPRRASAGASTAAERGTAAGGWRWPVEGEVVRPFSPTGERVNKGVDLRGAAGAAVRAAARGTVVYVGSGLGGWEQLVIIEHGGGWLSAYAHNNATRVTERDQLEAGATVAELGNADRQRLVHFEVRREGKPVDPASVLP